MRLCLRPAEARGKWRQSRRRSFDANIDLQRAPMQSAFLMVGTLPPPATRADVLPWKDGTRARRTTDARVAAIVQRIVGNGMSANVGPDFVLAPVSKRIELGDATHCVELLDFQLGARYCLRAPLAGDPCPS